MHAEEKRHILATARVPRMGDRRFHDWHHALFLPRGDGDEQGGGPAPLRTIHALGGRGHAGRVGWDAHYRGTCCASVMVLLYDVVPSFMTVMCEFESFDDYLLA